MEAFWGVRGLKMKLMKLPKDRFYLAYDYYDVVAMPRGIKKALRVIWYNIKYYLGLDIA